MPVEIYVEAEKTPQSQLAGHIADFLRAQQSALFGLTIIEQPNNLSLQPPDWWQRKEVRGRPF